MYTEGIYHIKEKLTRMVEKLAGKKKPQKGERKMEIFIHRWI